MQPSPILLQNTVSFMVVDLFGGAITDFHLKENGINPLTFRFSKEEMPQNNKEGAVYQGHFACIGRWGEPSDAEKLMGIPDHGPFANMLWAKSNCGSDFISMHALSELEGLYTERHLRMNKDAAVFHTTEIVKNVGRLGRLFNIVQHPTIAHPFLDAETRIFCNADTGYPYEYFAEADKMKSVWPMGKYPDHPLADLSFSYSGYSGVHSFIVNKEEEYGWLAAYSPQHHLLFGYVWNRNDYPWINLWCDYHSGKIRYRGLEFGTTGLHQSFSVMLQTGILKIFGEAVAGYIDVGQAVTKNYLCFLHKTEEPVMALRSIALHDNNIVIEQSNNNQPLLIPTGWSLEKIFK